MNGNYKLSQILSPIEGLFDLPPHHGNSVVAYVYIFSGGIENTKCAREDTKKEINERYH